MVSQSIPIALVSARLDQATQYSVPGPGGRCNGTCDADSWTPSPLHSVVSQSR